MEFTRVVLPTPGPPVITSTLERVARRSASRWLGARDRPVLALHPGDGALHVDLGPGRRPKGEGPQPLRDGLLGPVQARQEHAGRALQRVRHHVTCLELQLERRLDQLRGYLDQGGGLGGELRHRQAAMPFAGGLGQGEGDAGPDPDHGRGLDAELLGHEIGGAEADAADVTRQPVGVVGDHLHRIAAIGLVDPHRPRGADPVGMQEQHDLADRLLLGPAGDDARRPLGSDAGDLAQAIRLGLDQLEDGLAEGTDQLLGVDRADAADHAEPRYFSMPSRVVGGLALKKLALNCRPCVRSLIQVPESCTHSPALMVAACPTT
jgi:hypothetical protein